MVVIGTGMIRYVLPRLCSKLQRPIEHDRASARTFANPSINRVIKSGGERPLIIWRKNEASPKGRPNPPLPDSVPQAISVLTGSDIVASRDDGSSDATARAIEVDGGHSLPRLNLPEPFGWHESLMVLIVIAGFAIGHRQRRTPAAQRADDIGHLNSRAASPSTKGHLPAACGARPRTAKRPARPIPP